MRIRSWEHAIDLSIERRELSMLMNENYLLINALMKEDDWEYHCPLCEYIYEQNKQCEDCLWVKLSGGYCIRDKMFLGDNLASIKRLNSWKKRLKKEVIK